MRIEADAARIEAFFEELAGAATLAPSSQWWRSTAGGVSRSAACRLSVYGNLQRLQVPAMRYDVKKCAGQRLRRRPRRGPSAAAPLRWGGSMFPDRARRWPPPPRPDSVPTPRWASRWQDRGAGGRRAGGSRRRRLRPPAAAPPRLPRRGCERRANRGGTRELRSVRLHSAAPFPFANLSGGKLIRWKSLHGPKGSISSSWCRISCSSSGFR